MLTLVDDVSSGPAVVIARASRPHVGTPRRCQPARDVAARALELALAAVGHRSTGPPRCVSTPTLRRFSATSSMPAMWPFLVSGGEDADRPIRY